MSVIDSNKCKGADTIQVIKKYCGQSIYIPTAFSPNNDSKNDLFKATLFGDIPARFELYVYNRYGEVVFNSKDINKGWDGIFKGKLQPASSYVWRCIYQFNGKDLNNETGSVILIR
ncbi:MAG: gliding motility-associated C-terminal domain-containing protein [Ferruginibacter sp.]